MHDEMQFVKFLGQSPHDALLAPSPETRKSSSGVLIKVAMQYYSSANEYHVWHKNVDLLKLAHTGLLARTRSNFRSGEIEVTAFSFVEGRKVRMPIGLVSP